MRKDDYKNIIESHVLEHGDNKYAAYESAGKQFERLIREGKVNVLNISIKSLMEACLEQAGVEGIGLDSPIERLTEAVGSTSFPNITKYIVSSEVIPKFEYSTNRLAPLYTEGNSSRTDVERIAGFTANEGVEYVPEGYPSQETDFHEKYAEINLGKYNRTISLTKEAIYNDNTGQLIGRAASLGEVAGEQFEKFLIETVEIKNRTLLPFESGVGTSQYCAKFDGNVVTQAIYYSTDHSSYSYMGAQTNANKATATALDTDGLDTALRLFPNMKDERGEFITVNPRQLLVHTNNAMNAWQLTRSLQQYDTANNAKNPWGPGGMVNFDVVVSNYISTSTDWWMGDFKKQFVVLYWERPNISTQSKDSESAFTSDIVMRWKFQVCYGAGARDYRYVAKIEND